MRSVVMYVFEHTVIDSRLIVGALGAFLSVMLHELFHVWMHWGEIASIGLFTDPFTIMEVVVYVPPGYSVELEEAIAYGITLLTLLVTAMVIAKTHDKKDSRNLQQIFFPKAPESRSAEIYKQIHSAYSPE